MSIINEAYPFDVQAGVVGQASHRRWVGTITWTRDLATQVVTVSIVADLIEGTTTNGIYVYWSPPSAGNPEFFIPVEMRPEIAQYPYVDGLSWSLGPDGSGYAYLSNGEARYESSTRYVTGAPIQDIAPDTGSLLGDINARLEQVGVPVYPGFAPSGVAMPYIVTRPLDVGLDTELNLDGSAVDWNTQVSVYCAAAGVEASFNLALAVIGTLQGARVRGTTIAASMGYNGAPVEGHYESQVTAQLNQGGF